MKTRSLRRRYGHAADPIEYRAKEAIKRARKRWGDGWSLLSDAQKDAFIAEQIVGMLVGQDEESAPPQLRRLQQVAERALTRAGDNE